MILGATAIAMLGSWFTARAESATQEAEEARPPQVMAIEFVDSQTGWVLLIIPTAKSWSTVLVSTKDGGKHFTSAALDIDFAWPDDYFTVRQRARPAVGQIRFLDDRRGWLFAPDFLATKDGGHTWSRQERIVGALVPTAEAVWAIEAEGERRVVIRSADAGDTWVKTPAQPKLEGAVQLVAADRERAWILSGDTHQIFRTTDAGRHWAASVTPSTDYMGAVISIAKDRTLWFICTSEPATIMQGKAVYTSADGGAGWQLRAYSWLPPSDSTKTIGSVPICGGIGSQPYFAAVSKRVAFMALGRTTLYVTRDAGATWQESIPIDRTEEPGPLKFIDGRQGWTGTAEEGLMHTIDGGKTWTTVRVFPGDL